MINFDDFFFYLFKKLKFLYQLRNAVRDSGNEQHKRKEDQQCLHAAFVDGLLSERKKHAPRFIYNGVPDINMKGKSRQCFADDIVENHIDL